MIKKSDLNSKVDFWKKVLGLDGWEIKTTIISSSEMYNLVKKLEGEADKNELIYAVLVNCHPVEQIASIAFLKNADKHFGIQLNLDTLIIHELIHVATQEKFDNLPETIGNSNKIKELEEYIADFFARKLYLVYKKEI